MHIVQGLSLWNQNNKARPVKYAVNNASSNSNWILIFLVMHLYHFWIPSRFGGMANVHALENTTLGGYGQEEAHNLYKEMQIIFQNNLLIVVVYILGDRKSVV